MALRLVRAALSFPKHRFEPEDLLSFIEVRPFTAAWRDLDLDTDDLEALQVLIMCDPKRGAVIEGTGGLRKIRFASRRSNQGKSGGLRICYVYFEEFSIVLLVLVYAKNEQDDLSSQETAQMRNYIARQKAEFMKKPRRL